MACAAKKLTIMIMAVFSAMTLSYAQPKSIGTLYSFSGLGFCYEHVLNDECFISADIRAEMGEVFMNRTDMPGISASVTGNFILATWPSGNGNKINFFAGPGVVMGTASDYHVERGYFFGLKGRTGVECLFDRNISISASLNPIFGSHMVIMDDSVQMKHYKNGLINAILPEIGIKYLF